MADVSSLAAAPALTDASPVGSQSTERAQLQKLSQEFESMLLLQVMRQVRQTVSSFGDQQDTGALGGDMGTMFDTIDGELSRYLSQAGGFGLTGSLLRSLSSPGAPPAAAGSSPTVVAPASASQQATTQLALSTSAASVSAAASLDTSDVPAIQPGPDTSTGDAAGAASFLNAHVNSSFGWRSDPIQHVRRFHGGVDLRAAYGQEIPVAADGQVVSAGPQGEYGLSVVVDHGNGFQTRYAHLSAIDVAPGDVVADGTPIGRAGQSGRATGPHLHLEVLRNGERVDPREWLGSDEFKKVVARAD